MVRLRREKLAVEFVAFGIFVLDLVGLLEHRFRILGAGVSDIMVGDEYLRILDTSPLETDRNIRIAIEVVQHIDSVGIGGAHTVNHNSEEGAALHVHVAVQEHQCEEVVGG